jgi:hypothetical protein
LDPSGENFLVGEGDSVVFGGMADDGIPVALFATSSKKGVSFIFRGQSQN